MSMDLPTFGRLVAQGPAGIALGLVQEIGIGLAKFKIEISIAYVGMLADNWLPFKLMSGTSEDSEQGMSGNLLSKPAELFVNLGETIMPCWKPWGGTYKEGQCKE